MNRKFLEVLLGVSQILISLWVFSWESWNQIIISLILFLSGFSMILKINSSGQFQKIGTFLFLFAGLMAFLLILKLFLFG